jgi:hypothetical protein
MKAIKNQILELKNTLSKINNVTRTSMAGLVKKKKKIVAQR